MAALTEKAKQLGRDSAYSATESAKAMEFLAMAGLKPAEVIAAIGDTLNLAAAGSLDLATAADLASNALTAFKIPAEEMGRVADVMALTAASANTSVLQLGEALSYAAPQAAAAGWSIEQTAAAIGILGGVGIQGSRAGTTLIAIIAGLITPSDAAAKAMVELGISVADSSGKMHTLEEILKQINPAVLDTAEGLGKIGTIFGRRGAPGVTELIKQGADNVAGFTEQLENAAGAAEEMAKTKLDNLKGAFTLLGASIQGVGIELVTGGEKSLAGGMKSFITGSLIPMINKTSEWIKQVGGLPGMLAMAWEILVAFGNRIKEAFVKLGDWEIFSEFIWMMGIACAGMILSFSQFLGELILAIGGIAKVIWLPLVVPFSVIISQIQEKFGLFVNWLGQKAVDAANFLIKPFKWALDKLGIEIPELKWEPITVDPALTMKETWQASFQAIGIEGKAAYDRMKKATGDLLNNTKALYEYEQKARALLGVDYASFLGDVDKITAKYQEMGASPHNSMRAT
ncbi:hypothetical protein ES705_38636 [subsurface metagenome]